MTLQIFRALYEWKTGDFFDLSHLNAELTQHLQEIKEKFCYKLKQKGFGLRELEEWRSILIR